MNPRGPREAGQARGTAPPQSPRGKRRPSREQRSRVLGCLVREPMPTASKASFAPENASPCSLPASSARDTTRGT